MVLDYPAHRLVLPFTVIFGFQIRPPHKEYLNILYGTSILFVAPFLSYAIHSRKRLRVARSQQRPVIGGLVGISAVYLFFYVVFIPWFFAEAAEAETTDVHGMVEVMYVYFLFIVPLLGLGALVIGRKFAPPRSLRSNLNKWNLNG